MIQPVLIAPGDVDIALHVDRYDFAVMVEFENGRPVAYGKASLRLKSDEPVSVTAHRQSNVRLSLGVTAATKFSRSDPLEP